MVKLFKSNQCYFDLINIQLSLNGYWIYEMCVCVCVCMYVCIMYVCICVCTSQGLKRTYIPVSPTVNIKREPNEDACQLEDDAVRTEANETDDSNNELVLLGSIKAANSVRKVEKRKKIHTKELLKKKQAAQQEEQV